MVEIQNANLTLVGLHFENVETYVVPFFSAKNTTLITMTLNLNASTFVNCSSDDNLIMDIYKSSVDVTLKALKFFNNTVGKILIFL